MSEEIYRLIDDSILDWRDPVAKQYMDSGMPVFTKPIKLLGIDTLEMPFCPGLKLYGVAEKYEVEVARLTDAVYDASSEVEGLSEKMVLFDGELKIAQVGKVQGTDIEGMHFTHTVRIWLAKSYEYDYTTGFGLQRAIFDGAMDKLSRVEEIIRGIELCEKPEIDLDAIRAFQYPTLAAVREHIEREKKK